MHRDAESVFARWVARVEGGETSDFEELVRQHPTHAAVLRDLHREWKIFAPLLEQVVPGAMADAERALVADLSEPATLHRSKSSTETSHELGLGLPLSKRYRFRGSIGRGGGGVVIKVWDALLERMLAMKIVHGASDLRHLRSGSEIERRTLARFVDEARIASQLNHPGIVPVHDLGVDDAGRAFFTMKLVRGQTLAAVFEQSRATGGEWSQARVLGVLLRVCEALEYAHDKGVTHRDLKPQNVMVGRFGEVYVMDWGLAHFRRGGGSPGGAARTDESGVRSMRGLAGAAVDAEQRLTEDDDIIGTPAYMAPEQARSEWERVGARSDVYAVGVMLYELISGQLPYLAPGDRVSNDELLSRLMKGPPTPLETLAPHAPAELLAIASKAMAWGIDERYAAAAELAGDLRAFLEGRVVAAYESGTWAETKKWVLRNRTLAGAAAVALLASTTIAWISVRSAEVEAGLRREAEQRAAELVSLDALRVLKLLRAEAEQLWPLHPALLPSWDGWIQRADELVRGHVDEPSHGGVPQPGLAVFERKLVELRSRALSVREAKRGADAGRAERRAATAALDAAEGLAAPELLGGKHGEVQAQLRSAREELEQLERESDTAEEFRFADAGDVWLHDQLTELVEGLREFADAESGLLSSGSSHEHGWGVVKRYERVRTLESETISGPEASRLWRAAREDALKDAPYGGLDLRPQLGLLPIGPDPSSGLLEFVHVLSGETPRRGANGSLLITEDTGLVFVLLPASDRQAASAPSGLDNSKHAIEASAGAASNRPKVGAFFLSKYEMTQAQWLRIAGFNPSVYDSDYNERTWSDWKHDGSRWSPLHPVENVSWEECELVLYRMGLVLPSEQQWEYGARAGSNGSWFWQADGLTVGSAANLADKFGKGVFVDWTDWQQDVNDGYAVHAPVGRFAANSFGLHDVIGNVSEWCSDAISNRGRSAGGAPTSGEISRRARRGGSFDDTPVVAQVWRRFANDPSNRFHTVGVRPARALE